MIAWDDAAAYPFDLRPYSFLFHAGPDGARIWRWRPGPDGGTVDTDDGPLPVAALTGGSPFLGRIPVIACGSNRAPRQLARKYPQPATEVTVPVHRGRIVGFDVVYAAHLAGYGAVPATLAPSPGTTAEIAVTWLEPGHLSDMHPTEGVLAPPGEGNYLYARLEARLDLEGGAALDVAGVYVARRGAWPEDGDVGRPLALAAVAAEGRRFAAPDQAAMGRAADRHLVAQGLSGLDGFAAADAERRRRANDALAAAAGATAPGDWLSDLGAISDQPSVAVAFS